MNRIVNAITPLGDALKFKSLQGHEGLSCLSEWTVRFVSEHAKLDLQSMLGQSVTFEIETGASPRFLNGVVTGFELLHRETGTPRYYIYQATVRSWLWYATQNSDNRIFQNETAVDIITKVLGKYDFDVEVRLMNSYRKWGYCVQFQETDFSFVSRLMEHEGIYYWFRHEASRHVLVLTDEAQSHDPLPVLPVIPFYPDDRLSVAMQECIADWQVSGELTSTGYATMDYDFQKPLADMSAKRRTSLRATQSLDLEMYEPMGGYVDSSDSEHYVKVHLQSLQCLQEQAVARSNVRTMAPGYIFTLKNYPHQAENKAYLVVHTDYDIQNPAYASHDQPDDEARYVVASRHIPANVQYRAARSTPIPKMNGPQTATVVGPQGEEIWTDKYGRIKVQFHWDREGAMDENSSCWIRVSNPWAGGGFGGVQIPRVREEVVVDFINGNVDRPIAVGRVYNASNMPPVNLPDDATQSGFLTRSKNGTPANANKLMFEDRQGSELLAMVAEKDMDTHVKNNQTHDVAGNVVSAIGGLRSHTAHSTSDITMAAGAVKNYQADHNRTVQGSLDEQIGANLQQSFNDGVDETITGALTSTIGGQASHTLQGLHITTTTHDEETVNGTVSETVGTGETSNIKSGSQLRAGDITMASPTIYSESTQEEIDIKAGGSLDISSAGPGIVQTPGKIIKESPVNVETALMLDNNTVTRKKSYTLDLSVDGIKDVMVAGHNHNQNIADIKLYGMGDSMQAANIGLYGANIQLGGQDQKMGLLNVNITGIELDKGFKIKRPGGGGGVGTKGKGKDGSGGDGGKGGKGDKDGNGNRGDAEKPPANCKRCINLDTSINVLSTAASMAPMGSGADATAQSVCFAMGDETFSHLDFELPGAIPIIWKRTYRSNCTAFDERGALGHRWLNDYTIRIDDNGKNLIYLCGEGRQIDRPYLDVGESFYDRKEQFTWSRPSVDTIMVNHKDRRRELYKQSENGFKLQVIYDINDLATHLFYTQTGLLLRLETDIHTVNFEHDDSGRIIRIGQQRNDSESGGSLDETLASYLYDEQGDLVQATDEYGNKYHYTYSNHLITRYTDKTDRGINLEWDGNEPTARCLLEYADDGSRETRFSWDRKNNSSYVTDALGQTTRYVYNSENYINEIHYSDGTRLVRTRDEFNNITSVTFPDSTSRRFIYDSRDNMVEMVRQDGLAVRWEYDEFNRPVRIHEPSGALWQREYDKQRNLSAQVDPLGHRTEYVYNNQRLPILVVDGKQNTKRITYTASGQIKTYSDCSNKTTTWSYDDRDRVCMVVNAEGEVLSYTYAENGTVAGIEHDRKLIVQLQYDAENRLLEYKDALGRTRTYEYDASGDLIFRVDPLQQIFKYNYDRKGRLSELVNENGDMTKFSYDPLGRLVMQIGFDGRSTEYHYDKYTGVLTNMRVENKIISFQYNILRQMISRSSPSGTERFEYDAAGRLIQANNQNCQLTYSYDHMGNLLTEDHRYILDDIERRYCWKHSYDELSNRVSSKRPDGTEIDFLRYGSGYLHGILVNQNSVVDFERDNLHREVKRTGGNEVFQNKSYDKTGRLSRHAVTIGQYVPQSVFNREYHYDGAGRLKIVDESAVGMIHYRYDPLDRLMSVRTPQLDELFTFDPAGNLSRHEEHVAVDRMNGQHDNRHLSDNTLPEQVSPVLGNLLKNIAGIHFEYDSRGNVTRKVSPEGTQQFHWDGFDRLVQVDRRNNDRPEFTTVRYFYDPIGRRIGKCIYASDSTSLAGPILYGWDGMTMAFEESGDDVGSVTHYLYEDDGFEPLMQYVTTKHTQSAAGTARNHRLYYYICDQIGTPQSVLNDTGEVVWRAQYKALGPATIVTDSEDQAFVNNLRFQGQYWDEESELHYNTFRYYDPQVGRFIQQDPIGLVGGENLYLYAPNPVGWSDPLGLANRPNNGKYHIFFNYILGDGDRFASDAVQFRLADNRLMERMNSDPTFRRDILRRQPEMAGWLDNQNGKRTPGFTWHHHEDTGRLVLVDRNDHRSNHALYHPTGKGGRDIWGGGEQGRNGKLDGRTGEPKAC
ncbi:type VI secretion system tip protein TssI/VgrG [Advenella sp. FME57]|uniref:type VI secretion system tip protein TssI/VgrG n=1 Tax=Advenella sp. FME57 TaxID=2742604 RepID=UPI001866A940|nr:type VI secretion system tip protein TssI/VgrG [Advenella sp. FME57]